MASLELDPASGRYRVRFRFDGQAYKRSLHTKLRRTAMATLGQVEETLRLLKLGMTELPAKVEPGDFIISGARSRREKLPHSPVRTLAVRFSGGKLAPILAAEYIVVFSLESAPFLPRTRSSTVAIKYVEVYVDNLVATDCCDRFSVMYKYALEDLTSGLQLISVGL